MPSLAKASTSRNGRYPAQRAVWDRRSAQQRKGRDYRPPPKPANDNKPPPGPEPENRPTRAANSNTKQKFQFDARKLGRKALSGFDLPLNAVSSWAFVAYNIDAALGPDQQQYVGRTFRGWTKILDCPGGPPVLTSNFSSTGSCLTGQVVFPVTTVTNRISYWYLSHPNLTRYGSLREYTRPWSGAAQPIATAVPPLNLPYQNPLSPLQPWAWPLTDPLALPSPTPEAIPYRLVPYRTPNPELAPSERPDWGPYPLRPPYAPPSAAKPLHPDYNWTPNRPSTPTPPSHTLRPPPRGVRERKMRVPRALALAMKGAFAATEAIDGINAVFDALPKKYQRATYQKYGTAPQDKIRGLVDYYQHIDISQAAVNLLFNHYSDKLIGGAHAGAGKHPLFDGKIGLRNMFGQVVGGV